jgi:hypothetical protein
MMATDCQRRRAAPQSDRAGRPEQIAPRAWVDSCCADRGRADQYEQPATGDEGPWPASRPSKRRQDLGASRRQVTLGRYTGSSAVMGRS